MLIGLGTLLFANAFHAFGASIVTVKATIEDRPPLPARSQHAAHRMFVAPRPRDAC